MVVYEVDLRDRRTGKSIECIYSGDDPDKAYDIAKSYNEKNIDDYDVDIDIEDYIDFETDGLIANVYECYGDDETHGIGKW